MSRLRTAKALVLVLTLLVAVLANPQSAAAATSTTNAATAQTAHYGGRSIFNAIAFGKGSPELLAKVSASTTPDSPALSAATTRLTDRMDALDSTFFARFASQIQSGNRVAIRAALEGGRTLSQAAARAEFGVRPVSSAGVAPDCVDVFVVVAFALAIVIFIDAVAVGVLDVNAVVLVNVQVAAALAATRSTSPGLARDLLVDRLARAFAS